MVLQIAVGPVCLWVLDVAVNSGFVRALSGVMAVGLADAVYMALAAAGVSAFLAGRGYRRLFAALSSAVVFLFGASMLLRSTLLYHGGAPSVSPAGGGAFLQGLLLTASNPLTILFWSGVFGARISEREYRAGEVFAFSCGAVASTIVFLSGVALAGRAAHYILPQAAIRALNALAGCALILFAVRGFVSGMKKAPYHDQHPCILLLTGFR
jgi:threonine/homoserine/homoserine lactone efflux protein